MLPSSEAEAATRAVLADHEGSTDADAQTLTALVAEHLPLPGVGPRGRVEPSAAGVRAAVAVRAAAVGALGSPGSPLRRAAEKVSAEMRENAEARLAEWKAGGPPPWEHYAAPTHYVISLAHALWDGELERRKSQLPGTIDAVAEGILSVATRDLVTAEVAGKPTLVRAGRREPVAMFDESQRGIIEAALELRVLGSAYALPLVEYLVELSQAGARGAAGVTVEKQGAWLQFASWERLAEGVLERKPRSQMVSDLRVLANALSHMRIRWPDGSSSTAPWTLHDDDQRPGRPRYGPTFSIDSRLQMGEASRARKGRPIGGREREGLRIVPLVRPRVVAPEPTSQANTQAAQVAFVRHLWRHFVRRGHCLAEEPGGVPVTAGDLRALAEDAQLPRRVEARMLEHLRERGVIVAFDAERWAPADAATRAFIIDGWKRRASRPPRLHRRARSRDRL